MAYSKPLRLGRLSQEAQRLYRPGPNGQSEVEFEHTTRHQLDTLGNRLPTPSQDSQGPGMDWAARVYAHWQQEHFNLLGQEQAAPQTHGPMTRWADNRIGYSADAVWRYDECGNRVEQLGRDGRRQRLGYDGGHQLIEVTTQGPSIGDGQEQPVQASTSRYTYDALGRRLKKHSEQGSGQTTTRYFGWNGAIAV